MDDEIDLRDIIDTIWRNRILIAATFVISVFLAALVAFSLPSVYNVSSIIAVGNFEDSVYSSQASAISIMLSDEFLGEVFGQVRPDAKGSEFSTFRDRVRVEPVKNSDRLIEISVDTPDGSEGKRAVEEIIKLYANLSEESYKKQRSILSSQLAVSQEHLNAIDMQINLTQGALADIETSSDSSAVQSEIRFSRTLDRLSGMVTQRSAMIDRCLDLQKKLDLLSHLDIVQPAREPLSPIGPRSVLIVSIAGVFGLMLGIFAAFFREWQNNQAK